MNFVGVQNCPIKSAIMASDTGRLQDFAPMDLAFDCIRHIDFLRRLEQGMTEDEFPASLYWKYIRLKGGNETKALVKSRRLKDLFASVKAKGFLPGTPHAEVTTDGIRLDGSHRAAAAAVLGLDTLTVRIHAAGTTQAAARLTEEAAVKRAAQTAAVGKTAYLHPDQPAIGRVAFVDARPAPVFKRLFAGVRWIPVAVVEMPNGELIEHDQDQLTLISDS